MREIHSRGAVPIIVGGTNQYIEALLWEDALTVGKGTSALRLLIDRGIG